MRAIIFLLFLSPLWGSCDHSNPTVVRVNNSQTQFFYHNLLFQWKDSIDPLVRDQMLALLKGIPNKIEGFESVEFRALEPSEGNFDLLIIQKYTNREAEKSYQEHPDHLKAKSMGPQLLAKMAEFDYWGE